MILCVGLFVNEKATTEIYTYVHTLSLPDALPISLDLLHTITGEDLHVDNRTLNAGRHAQRRILHIARLLTEDGTQQLFFRCQLGFALGRDLADQDRKSTRLNSSH